MFEIFHSESKNIFLNKKKKGSGLVLLLIKIKGINLGWFILQLSLFQGIFQGISEKNIRHIRPNIGQHYLNKIIQNFISLNTWLTTEILK